jgi:hypothetical protein
MYKRVRIKICKYPHSVMYKCARVKLILETFTLGLKTLLNCKKTNCIICLELDYIYVQKDLVEIAIHK